MTFADVMTAHLDGAPTAALEAREADTRRFLTQFGEVPDAAWKALRSRETPNYELRTMNDEL